MAPPAAAPATYRNPIIAAVLADPFILRANDEYYLYASPVA